MGASSDSSRYITSNPNESAAPSPALVGARGRADGPDRADLHRERDIADDGTMRPAGGGSPSRRHRPPSLPEGRELLPGSLQRGSPFLEGDRGDPIDRSTLRAGAFGGDGGVSEDREHRPLSRLRHGSARLVRGLPESDGQILRAARCSPGTAGDIAPGTPGTG